MGDTQNTCLESIRRNMKEQLNLHISRSAFWERLATQRLKKFLQTLLGSLMTRLTFVNLGNKEWIEQLGITKLWVIDSCSFSLWDGAKDNYPGTRTKAGIKWHACVNLINGALVWSELTPTSTHDRVCFPDVNKISGGLIIFDLGYWDFSLLWDIQAIGGFFLSRIKSKTVILVKEVIEGMSAKKYIGKSLLSIKHHRKKGNIIEAIVEKACGKNKILTCRAIGFWNPTEKKYHWYLTNLKVNAAVIYPLYRFRWQIELIFKSCKQSLNASRLTSNDPNIIESLLLATIIAKLVSQTILHIAIPFLNIKKRFAISYQRITKIAAQLYAHFINLILKEDDSYLKILINKIQLFVNEVFDPNYKHRKTTLAQIIEALGCDF